MEDIVKSIQNDIIDPKASLSTILFKAKVLSYELQNEQFKQWVGDELDGYTHPETIPDYRIIPTASYGVFSNGFHQISNLAIPTIYLPDWLRERVRYLYISSGIRTIEELSLVKEGIKYKWPAEWLMVLNQSKRYDSYNCLEAVRPAAAPVFAQILETVRSRLLDFILELSILPWKIGQGTPPTKEIQTIFNVTIYNNTQGGSVSTFDQRGQHVNYQYNAVGSINFGAVQNQQDFISQLENLKTELNTATAAEVIDIDTATDVEYQLTKAINHAKKSDGDRNTVIEHLGNAKTMIESIAAASGLIKGFVDAASAAQKFFGG